MNTPGSVAAIIVNWNSAEACLRCRTSLLHSVVRRSLRIFIIDNASREMDRDLLSSLPSAELRLEPTNLGFAGACNRAATECQEDYLLFLNPDIEETGEGIERLASWLDQHREAAGASGNLLGWDGRPQFDFMVRRLPSLGRAIAQALLLNRLMRPFLPPPGGAEIQGWPDSAFPVEQPAGACLMIRREIFEQLSGFDSSYYPAWYEDVDLCRRIKDAGLSLYLVPSARFRHAGQASLETLRWFEFLPIIYRNEQRYFARHHGRLSALILRSAVTLGMIMRLLLLLFYVDPRAGSRREAARAYLGVLACSWRDDALAKRWPGTHPALRASGTRTDLSSKERR